MRRSLIRLTALGIALLAILAALQPGGAPSRAQGPPQAELELGARLYAENCAVCHGPNGEGRVGATLAKNWPSIRADLRHHRGGGARLPDARLEQEVRRPPHR
ncbi:MAG: c-type cytochrome [Chloroflexi bacterium]|nr:c-type cytochrome [Chloroflexota bacterium]